MYIHSINHYLPEQVIPNSYFKDVNGLSDEWITTRTGIKERRRAKEGENTNSIANKAVKNLLEKSPINIKDIDLIIGSSYSPYDTVSGIAHAIQAEWDIDAIAINISTACSTFINSLEIVQGYFALGKAKNALIVASEQNSAYSHDEDDKSGHLWGDGAAAVYITKERTSDQDLEIIDVITKGHGNVGKGPEGVWLRPNEGNLVMPFGKDVFIHACNYMTKTTQEILTKNNYTIDDVTYLIPHQANVRIINNVSEQLGLDINKVIININKYGNTGSASTAIGLSENFENFKKGDLIAISVFGGGYSSGSALIKR